MAEKQVYTRRDELPVVLQARHIADILTTSLPTVYTLMKRADFPAVCLGEKRVIVPRDQFFDWLEAQSAVGVSTSVGRR